MRRLVLPILAAVAALIGVCAVLFFFGFFPQAWLRPLVERQIHTALGPGSRIGSLHVVPGRLRAEARDVLIEGPGFRLEAPRMTIAIAFPTLLGRAVAIRSLTVESPVLTAWPVEPTKETSDTAKPFEQSVLVGGIAITDGVVIYRDPAMGGDWRVDDVDITGGVGKGTLKLTTGPVRWEREPQPLVLDSIRATASLSSLLEATVESLEMGTGRSKLVASGDVGDVTKPVLDLQLKVQLDLADLAMVPNAPKASGMVQGQMHVTGEAAAINARGTVEGRALEVGGRRIDAATIQFTREGTRTHLDVEARALGGRVNADAKLDGDKIEASARGQGLDLRALAGPGVSGRTSLDARVRGTLGQRLETAVRLDAAGQAATNVDFTAKADATGALVGAAYDPDLRWSATGTAQQPADPDGAPSLQALDWKADGTAAGAWPAPAVNGQLSGNGRFAAGQGASPFQVTGTVRGKGETTAANLLVTGDLGHMTVDATMARGATRFTVDGRDVRLERFVAGTSGVATFAFQGRSGPGGLTTSGRGTIAGLVSNDVRFGDVAIEATAEGDVTRARIRVPEMKANVDATVAPLRRGSSALGVTARLELQETPLAPFAPMAGRPLAGRVRGTFDIRAPLDAPATATVAGRIEALDFESQKLKATLQQPAEIEATSRRMSVRGLALEGPGFDLRADGSFGLVPAEPMDARLQATVDMAQVPVPVEWTITGAGRADVRLQGTRARPLAHGSVDLEGFTASGPQVPALRADKAQLQLDGETLRIPDTQASLAGGTLRVSGIIPMSSVIETPGRAEPAHLDLVWSGLDAAQIHMAAAPESEVAVTGVLEGEAHVVGPLRSMNGLTARVRTPTLRLNVEQMPVTISGLSLDVANGRATLASMQLVTPHGSLQIGGSANLDARTIDGAATGALDLRALSPFMENAALTGKAELNLTVKGPFDALRPDGRMVVSGGILRMRDIQPAISDINGAILFDGSHVRITETKARWGGGPLTVSGQAALGKGGFHDADFTIKGEQMALRYLEARMLANADLKLTGRTGDLQLRGSLALRRGLYTENLFLDDPLRGATVRKVPSPFLQTMGLDLSVRVGEFVVSNNIANLRGRGTFTIRGTADEPTPIGRLDLLEGGTVLVQQKTFKLIEDNNSLRFEGTFFPDLAIVAETRTSWRSGDNDKKEGDIRVTITGNVESPRLAFESRAHADLTETQLASIIATGTENPIGVEAEWLVGAQAASLLASRLTQGVSQQLRGLGLDEVRIEPDLIQREAHPSARLTFGKNLTSWSTLIYSYSLESAEDRLFRLDVRPISNVSTNIARREDRTLLGGLSHQFQLGGPERRRRGGASSATSVALSDVRYEGDIPVSAAEIEQWTGVRPGQERALWDLHDAADALQRRLVERGHIEAQVGASLEGTVATFSFNAGPRYDWRVTGMDSPPDLTPTLRKALYAEEALASGAQRLLDALRGRGHFDAVVRTQIQDEGGGRVLVFTAAPGPVYGSSNVVFEGARALSQGTLLEAAGGVGELVTEPARARRRIQERYAEEFFLDAKVGPPRIERGNGRITVQVPVREGLQANVTRLTFPGSSLDPNELAQMAPGILQAPPDELRIAAALKRIRERYFTLGYPYVRVTSRLVPQDADLEMRVDVHEGPQVHIREIAIEGTARVPEKILRSALPFREGQPLDPRKLIAAETRLARYKLARTRVAQDEEDPSRIVVTVRPPPRLTVDYGVELDSTSSVGVNATVRAPNLLPRGVTPGAVLSEKRFDRNIRASLGMPAVFHRGMFDVAFTLRDRLQVSDGSRPGTPRTWKEDGGVPPFEFRILERRGSVAQNVEIGGRWILEYGYDLSHVTTTGAAGSPLIVPVELDVGKVRLSLLRDTRDNLLDARNGRFWNIALSYAPKLLGTDFEFVRGYGQLFVYRSLMPQLTWAHAYRVGLGVGLGEGAGARVFVNDRFTAGGPSTLRGYATDSVGPISESHQAPESGDALLVLNQELRYHHPTGLGAVIFYDAGNVYRRLEDVDLDLRHAAGVGLRYDSPVGLLRVDLGVPLNRRPEIDGRYQVYFSFGQAF